MTAWAATTLAFYGSGGAPVATSVVKLRRRIQLSQAKHRSLAGHSRMARRLAAVVPFYEYDEARFFRSDGAPADVAQCRRAGFERLSALYKTRFAETIRRTEEAAGSISDLDGNRFYDVTGSYGVNVLGYEFYKGAIERGAARVRELGPVLGPYHPLILENVNILKKISGHDEVSFHMSG